MYDTLRFVGLDIQTGQCKKKSPCYVGENERGHYFGSAPPLPITTGLSAGIQHRHPAIPSRFQIPIRSAAIVSPGAQMYRRCAEHG